MKLKEKLAEDYLDTDGQTFVTANTVLVSFEAGFKKALELASQVADEYSYREGTKGPSTEIGESIRKLGEEEVE